MASDSFTGMIDGNDREHYELARKTDYTTDEV